jgi:hypothetical protein
MRRDLSHVRRVNCFMLYHRETGCVVQDRCDVWLDSARAFLSACPAGKPQLGKAPVEGGATDSEAPSHL